MLSPTSFFEPFIQFISVEKEPDCKLNFSIQDSMPAIIWARNTHCTERNAKQKAMPNKWPHSTPAALALVVSTALLEQAKKTSGHFPCAQNTPKASPAHTRAGLPAEQARKHENWRHLPRSSESFISHQWCLREQYYWVAPAPKQYGSQYHSR